MQKHHYRELSERVREIFGSIPDRFVQYWMDKFPKLVLHTWLAMQCVRQEDVFRKYYSGAYTFPRLHDGVPPAWIQQALNSSPSWRLPGRPLVTRYGPTARDGPFASLYANGRDAGRSWRLRNRAAVGGPNAEEGEVTEKADGLEVVEDAEVPASTVDDVDAGLRGDCVLDDDQENVEPSNGEPIVEVEGKAGKVVRNRRGGRRYKKKLGDSGSPLPNSVPAD